jgi:hypothetical protein
MSPPEGYNFGGRLGLMQGIIAAPTVYKLCAKGAIEHVRVLNSIRFTEESRTQAYEEVKSVRGRRECRQVQRLPGACLLPLGGRADAEPPGGRGGAARR